MVKENENENLRVHWSDMTAERIIKQLGDKDEYVLASGITPSGVVHFGNFREVITVDLVARALKERGKNVRFIFSWDDYDTFRKIPANMPKQDELKKYMFQPIVDTPDPFGRSSSYAAHHEENFMGQLEKVGITPEPLYQAKKYRAGEYRDGIKKTLQASDKIKEILNAHRSTPLGDDWLPISLYCEKSNTDKMKWVKWDGDDTLTYESEAGHEGELKLSSTKRVKLPWRLDWPMRWAHEQVDFEPGGKDHSSQGGSYSTAKDLVKEIYDYRAPIYLQYDFVSIKGAGGKMSSSSGNVITIDDVLCIYEPEMVRWIFASYKTNVDFSVSFDLDVIKTYEDFDRQERIAYEVDQANEKKTKMAKRVFQLSSLDGNTPAEMPFQPAFRHLCNILQINDGDIEKTKNHYVDDIKNPRDERRFNERAKCAWYWVTHYAPEEFKYRLNKDHVAQELNDKQSSFIGDLKDLISGSWDSIGSDKELNDKMYEIIHKYELSPGDVFPVLYRYLISKEKGPKIASFIRTIGKERMLVLLP